MIIEDIILIEKKLNISLVESYKEVILANPLSDKMGCADVYESLCDDPQKVIKMNLELRENGYQNKVWAPNLFAIGTNGEKCYYFINLDEKTESNIYLISEDDKFNPQNIKKHIFCKSYTDFIEMRKFLQKMLNRRKNEKIISE